MTLMKMKRKCMNCGTVYSWNPDVGKMACPKCGSVLGGKGLEIKFEKPKSK